MEEFPVFPAWMVVFWPLVVLAAVWDAVWKGIALWRAARNGHLVWFIFLLIVNSLGILPIIYTLAFSQRRQPPQSPPPPPAQP